MKERNINSLGILPIARRSGPVHPDFETPKTPREMIREMSHPAVVFGSGTPITPTIFVNFEDEGDKDTNARGPSSDAFHGTGSDLTADDYSWDFKCRGSGDSNGDILCTFNILCDLQDSIPGHASSAQHTPATMRTRPTEESAHSAILEEMERNLLSRHDQCPRISTDKKPVGPTRIIPILCIDDVPPPAELQRCPLVVLPPNSQPNPTLASHQGLRRHVRTSSLSHGENVPARTRSGAKPKSVSERRLSRPCGKSSTKKAIAGTFHC